jgi:gamma-glutamyltranspeptidase/glutathione hydrolase
MVLFRPELRGDRGAVAATHWLASAAGMAMLERGGNAFDAATAAAFVLQVVEPHLNGPGGDVPILLFDAARGEAEVICGQGPMPAAATIGHFRGLGLDRVPGSGLLAACVPGAFGAWMRLLREHGRLRLAEVVEPAIGYAAAGYPLLPTAARTIAVLAPLFRTEWAESGRVYLDDRGQPPAPGSRVRNPVLARMYQRLVAEACAGTADRDEQIAAAEETFYRGFVAQAIDDFIAGTPMLDATGARHRGLLTGDDLARWRASAEVPTVLRHGEYAVHKPGPWSQGPVFLQQLSILDGVDLAGMPLGSADYLHTVVESAKLALADREAFYGDPSFVDVPLDALLDSDYAAKRRALIGAEASGTLRPGAPGDAAGWIPDGAPDDAPPAEPAWRAHLDSGLPTLVRLTEARGDTCCVSAVDRSGNLVVATPSGGWLKSSPVVPGLGFPLGTRGQMAWLVDGHPNSLAPGKRPRTTLSPTLVLRAGEPYLAFGTPGGDQQDQWTLSFYLAHVRYGLGVQEAIESLPFHTDHAPSSFVPRRSRPRSLVTEHRADSGAVAELSARGHLVELMVDHSLGRVCATGIDPRTGFVIGAASPRGEQAYAIAR